uniref:G-protein coupled receptors family 1 profile domain-containing protein n=1 Tax=Romanomermis culicivorax TaxID=13658 RepID=A0A915JJ50_ROMCU
MMNFTASNTTNFCATLPQKSNFFTLTVNILYVYFLPLVVVVGVTGNILNLLVLNGKSLVARSKAKYFLSAMALSDLGFLPVMLLLNLRLYEALASMAGFARWSARTKMTLTFFANTLLASSACTEIQFAVCVTVERLVAIRSPLHAHMFLNKRRVICILCSIFLLSIILNVYHFFWLSASVSTSLCGKERVEVRWLNATDIGYLAYKFREFSITISPFFVTILPFFLVVFLDFALIYFLRESEKGAFLRRSSSSQSSTTTGQSKAEAKMTITVLIIVITFSIFCLPSVVLYWLTTMTDMIKAGYQRRQDLVMLFNFLVALNKTLNFVIFCLSSSNFRSKLIDILCKIRKNKGRLLRRDYSSGGGKDGRRVSSPPTNCFISPNINAGDKNNSRSRMSKNYRKTSDYNKIVNNVYRQSEPTKLNLMVMKKYSKVDDVQHGTYVGLTAL